MGIYRNTDNSLFIDDDGRVVGPGGSGKLSDERARAILKTRPTGLERIDAPPPKPTPAPKPKAKVEAPKPTPKPKAKKGE